RVDFKILMLTYKALHGLAPQYLSELLSPYSPPRNLRSSNSALLTVPPSPSTLIAPVARGEALPKRAQTNTSQPPPRVSEWSGGNLETLQKQSRRGEGSRQQDGCHPPSPPRPDSAEHANQGGLACGSWRDLRHGSEPPVLGTGIGSGSPNRSHCGSSLTPEPGRGMIRPPPTPISYAPTNSSRPDTGQHVRDLYTPLLPAGGAICSSARSVFLRRQHPLSTLGRPLSGDPLAAALVRHEMTEFWQEHSQQATVEEMMLDSNAQLLTKHELPEILALLPDLEGLTVLELGAGIGLSSSVTVFSSWSLSLCDSLTVFPYLCLHSEVTKSIHIQHTTSAVYKLTIWAAQRPVSYALCPDGTYKLIESRHFERYTAHLVKKVRHVTAVDFMQKFVDRNRQENGHQGNADFIQSDVTQLRFPDNSFDLIFSNWLLMYLSDAELLSLTRRMLGWLRPGGYLFFRESCFHKSGDSKRSFNPSLYRTPASYNHLVTSAVWAEPEPSSRSYGFEIVMTKSVQTYIKAS
ncbi:PEAM3 methyltransferase, partial [Atractosteus spatula]|nr:PEAM3 methyltransferase [Atractosteus spatula]